MESQRAVVTGGGGAAILFVAAWLRIAVSSIKGDLIPTDAKAFGRYGLGQVYTFFNRPEYRRINLKFNADWLRSLCQMCFQVVVHAGCTRAAFIRLPTFLSQIGFELFDLHP